MSAVFRLLHRSTAPRSYHAARSWAWRRVKRTHLRAFPSCAACGSKHRVTAHHIIPFSVDPSLELLPSNLLTLCEGGAAGFNCHLYIGHGGEWSLFNPYAREDAATMLADIGTATLHAVLRSRRPPLIRVK